MSGSVDQESVRSAVPVANLSALDAALVQGDEVVRETLRKLRPADVGRDLSRRDVDEARRTVGSLIPLGAQRVGIDPTVVSGPLITTLVDASGLFLYLTIAHAMVAQLRGH